MVVDHGRWPLSGRRVYRGEVKQYKPQAVRKRGQWTRSRAKRGRPKTPAPTTGWLLAELAALTEIPITTVRHYVVHRLLRPGEFRGTLTRYQRRELLRLVAIRRLKAEQDLTLDEIRRKFEELGEASLEEWIRSGPLSPTVAAALGIELPPVVPVTAGTVGAFASSAIEHWQRITLLPGLELMLRSDAKPAAVSAAQRICEEYVVR